MHRRGVTLLEYKLHRLYAYKTDKQTKFWANIHKTKINEGTQKIVALIVVVYMFCLCIMRDFPLSCASQLVYLDAPPRFKAAKISPHTPSMPWLALTDLTIPLGV